MLNGENMKSVTPSEFVAHPYYFSFQKALKIIVRFSCKAGFYFSDPQQQVGE